MSGTLNLLPVSMAEFERWVVDAPRGRHWILSERKLPESTFSIATGLEIVVWGRMICQFGLERLFYQAS